MAWRPTSSCFSRLHFVSRKSRVRVSSIWALLHTKGVENEGTWRDSAKGHHSRHPADSHGSAVNRFLTPSCVLIFRTAHVNRLMTPDDCAIFSDNEMLYTLNSKSIYHHQSKQQKQNNLKNRQKTWINIPPTHMWQTSTWKRFRITNI